jgi:phospholipase C
MRLFIPAITITLAGIACGLALEKEKDPFPIPSFLEPNLDEALAALGKTRKDLRKPGSVPDPRHAPGTDLLPGIEHIVLIMFENHSFDNIWGLLEREDVDGFPIDKHTGKPSLISKYDNGTIQHAFPMVRTCQNDQPMVNWNSSHFQYNNGSMNGWVTAGGYKPVSTGYFTKEQLPFLNSWA